MGFVRSFLGAEKLVAAICHAPWLLVEADAVRGRRVTSWPSVRTDLGNAGATWVDEQVVIDDQGAARSSPLSTDRDLRPFASARHPSYCSTQQ